MLVVFKEHAGISSLQLADIVEIEDMIISWATQGHESMLLLFMEGNLKYRLGLLKNVLGEMQNPYLIFVRVIPLVEII